MNDAVITVENLGKKYRIRHDDKTVTSYVALRDVIIDRGNAEFRAALLQLADTSINVLTSRFRSQQPGGRHRRSRTF